MKIYLERLKTYTRLNPLLLLFVILGSVLSVMYCYFIYGNLMPSVSYNSKENDLMYMHQFHFPENINSDQAMEIIDSFRDLGIDYAYVTPDRDYVKINPNEFKLRNELIAIIENKYLKNKAGDDTLKLPLANEIYIYDDHNPDRKTNLPSQGTITINDKSLKIAGDYGYGLGLLVSLDFIKENKIPIGILEVRTSKFLNYENSKNHIDKVVSEYKGKVFLNAASQFKRAEEKSPLYKRMIISMSIVATLSYTFICSHLISLQGSNNKVVLLQGFSKGKINLLILLDIVTLAIISIILGSIIFMTLFKLFIFKYMIFSVVEYQTKDFMRIALIIFMISIFVNLPIALIRRKKELKNEAY